MADEPEVEERDFVAKKYKERVLTVEAVQFDGENEEDVIAFVGGPDYGAPAGDKVLLSIQGKDPRSQKVTVSRGQWVSKSKTGTVVVNEGEFAGQFVNEDGSDIEALPPPTEEVPVVAEEDLVYQPGFAPPPKEGEKAEAKPAEERQQPA